MARAYAWPWHQAQHWPLTGTYSLGGSRSAPCVTTFARTSAGTLHQFRRQECIEAVQSAFTRRARARDGLSSSPACHRFPAVRSKEYTRRVCLHAPTWGLHKRHHRCSTQPGAHLCCCLLLLPMRARCCAPSSTGNSSAKRARFPPPPRTTASIPNLLFRRGATSGFFGAPYPRADEAAVARFWRAIPKVTADWHESPGRGCHPRVLLALPFLIDHDECIYPNMGDLCARERALTRLILFHTGN